MLDPPTTRSTSARCPIALGRWWYRCWSSSASRAWTSSTSRHAPPPSRPSCAPPSTRASCSRGKTPGVHSARRSGRGEGQTTRTKRRTTEPRRRAGRRPIPPHPRWRTRRPLRRRARWRRPRWATPCTRGGAWTGSPPPAGLPTRNPTGPHSWLRRLTFCRRPTGFLPRWLQCASGRWRPAAGTRCCSRPPAKCTRGAAGCRGAWVSCPLDARASRSASAASRSPRSASRSWPAGASTPSCCRRRVSCSRAAPTSAGSSAWGPGKGTKSCCRNESLPTYRPLSRLPEARPLPAKPRTRGGRCRCRAAPRTPPWC
mmetsp:Transcript_22710/g.73533  ORF Transcript_22710/g.73533 Transcript_22710/m.73533 type:complete len:314 (-) Transcript_22710:4001-4942(-)